MAKLLSSIVVCGAAMLAGGARPPVIAPALPEGRQCCNSLADLPTQSLYVGQVRSIEFDAEKSPVFRFPEGNGVFAAFVLPQDARGVVLKVRTYVSTSILPMATMFKPNVMFLNAQHEPIEVSRDAPLSPVKGGLVKMSATSTFSVPNDAAYSIVYSGDPRSKRSIVRSANGTYASAARWPRSSRWG